MCPARTEQLKIAGMSAGISCADRYLRWLSAEPYCLLTSRKIEGDKTDTWELTELGKNTPELPEKKPVIGITLKPKPEPVKIKITSTPYQPKSEQIILL